MKDKKIHFETLVRNSMLTKFFVEPENHYTYRNKFDILNNFWTESKHALWNENNYYK